MMEYAKYHNRVASNFCPACGAALYERFGVVMPPFKAQMLDMIVNVTNGRGWITVEELIICFYPGVSRNVAKNRVYQHVNQINDYLAGTDIAIKGEGRSGRYKAIGPIGADDFRLSKEATSARNRKRPPGDRDLPHGNGRLRPQKERQSKRS